jgi:hypothetical protein
MPVYNNAIPQPTDNPSQSQDQLLQNFQVLDTAFKQDHSAYNEPTQGQHNQITFPVGPLTGQPFTYLASQIGLQSLNQAPTSVPDIWLSRGTATAYPMTGMANGAVSGNNAVAWTYFASGMIRIGGQATTSGGTVTITFANTAAGGLTSFPGFTTFISNIQAIRFNTLGLDSTVMRVISFNLTQVVFGLSNGAVDSTFFWSAEGF